MDLVSFSLIAAFCLVGAVIAYGADNLGRYLGKKRHTLFGLRPRHTATLLTVGAGFLLPALTVFVMWLVSKDVRIILAEGSRAAAERDRKTLELNQRVQEVAAKTLEIGNLERQRAVAQKNLSNAAKQLQSRKQEVDRLLSLSSKLRSQVADFSRQVRATRSQLASLKSQFDQLDERYRTISGNYKQVDASLRDANARNIQLDLEARRLEKEIDRSKKQYDELRTREENARRELDETASKYKDLEGQFAEAKRKSEADLERTRLQLDELRGEIDNLRQISQTLTLNVDSARTRPMIFQLGEELVRQPIPAGSNAEACRAALTSVLRGAKLEAQRRGADPSLRQAAAGLTELTGQGGQRVSIEEQENALIAAAVGKPDQMVYIANALWNSFNGEFVPLRVQALPNPVVFQMGQIIEEARIDGTVPEDGILQQISRFLTNDVQTRARLSRMIPAVGRVEQFGSVSSEEVLNLVKQIRSAGRIVRLQAIALYETRAADPLRLEFRIR